MTVIVHVGLSVCKYEYAVVVYVSEYPCDYIWVVHMH